MHVVIFMTAIGVDLTTSCRVKMKVGQHGVVFVGTDQRLDGHWKGFERRTHVIEALRGYGASTAERAPRRWSRSRSR